MTNKKRTFNPFTMFRKNQVILLASLGIMAMISFIILPAVMQLLPGIRYVEGQGDFASTRHHGKVDPLLLDTLRKNRENLARFYQRLWISILQSNPSLLTSREQLSKLEILVMKVGQLEGKINDEELINGWLVARYSEDQGVVVSPNMVIDLLKATTNNMLTKQNLNQVLEELNMSEQFLEYLLSEELRQNQMLRLFAISQNAVLPATRWDWYQRLNKKITLEVATLQVESFIDKVPDPTNAQIISFFNEHKKRQFNPTLPETGFAFPKQIAFSYIRGIPSRKILDSISKQDVEKYYNENKEKLFRKPVPQKKELPDLPGMSPDKFQLNEAIPNLNPTGLGGLGGLGNKLPGLEILDRTSTTTTQPETALPVTTPEIKQPTEQTPENKPKIENEKIKK
ncbi:MAG: SurA N-terminal domain-containing protein [Planctomycetaceae bacterium]|jgi:peptidyl-prolyl cis-trans isomerase D|nr:SurA N-terminal domain-containing protein [Planctomycetaceae bacterium]